MRRRINSITCDEYRQAGAIPRYTRTMKRFLPAVALALVSSLSSAQDARAKQIIDDALQALGGEKFLAMTDRVEQGRSYSFYREQLAGLSRAKIYTRYLTAPNPPQPAFVGIRERQAFGKDEDVFIVFNEQGGYEITYRGAKPLPEETRERYTETLLHNVLYTLRMRLGEPGLVFEYHGSDVFENQPVNIVDLIDADNRVTRVFFLQSDKFPVRQEWERRDPKTRIRIVETTVFAKYRDIGGGVMWPWVIRRERNGDRIFEMYCDAVSINQGLTDDLFTLDADVKILDKKKR